MWLNCGTQFFFPTKEVTEFQEANIIEKLGTLLYRPVKRLRIFFLFNFSLDMSKILQETCNLVTKISGLVLFVCFFFCFAMGQATLKIA